MTRLKYYAMVWFSLSLILAYFVSYSVVGYYHSKFAADLMAIIGVSFISSSTTPAAIRAFRRGIRSDEDLFLVSYWAIWTLVLVHRVWVITLSLLGRPPEFVESPTSGLIAVLLGLSAIYGGYAPLSGNVRLSRREIIMFFLAGGFAGFIAAIAVGIFIIAGWSN